MFVEISFEVNGSHPEIEVVIEKVRIYLQHLYEKGEIAKFSMEDENGSIDFSKGR